MLNMTSIDPSQSNIFKRHSNYYKKEIFFSQSIRMSGNSTNFEDKKNQQN